MSTLDDLERVEREIRVPTHALLSDDLILWADTIAAFVREQRERDAERDTLAAEKADCEKFLKEGERLDECLERWRADALSVLELLAQERVKSEALAAEVALRRSEVELFRDELKARCDEVAKLKAACAAKDAALRAATTLVRDCIPSGPDLHNACAALEAALSDDAGKNYVDASGAVEAEASRHVVLGNTWLKDGGMLLPGDWAGALVKIVRVKP